MPRVPRAGGIVGNLPDAEALELYYAQSAVFSPSDFPFARDGKLVEATPNTEPVFATELDLDALESAIHGGSVWQRADRRPDHFRCQPHLHPEADVPF